MVQQNLQIQTSEAELHSLQNQWQQVTGQKNHIKCSQIQDKPRNQIPLL